VTEESADPCGIHSLAVHRSDVLVAFEAQERDRKPAVLRIVAPFSGRMRARLHVADEAPESDELHVHPRRFLKEPPSFPHVDETADELREASTYDLDRHREAHERAVAAWREQVDERLRERVTLPLQPRAAVETLDTTENTHEVTISYLG